MAEFRTIILLNLRKWDNPKKPGTGYSLDFVHSVADGQSKGVGVEFVYYKDGGAKRIGKPLQLKDLETIFGRREEFKALAKNPPPIPPLPEPEPLTGGMLGGDGKWGDRTEAGGGLGGGALEREEF